MVGIPEKTAATVPVEEEAPFLDGESRSLLQSAARGATVIWDFDGVIADSEPLHRESYRVLLASMGNGMADFDFGRYMGRSEPDIWKRLSEDGYSLEQPVDTLIRKRAAFILRAARRGLAPTRVVRELGEAFADTCCRQVVVSSGQPEVIARLLKHWHLDRLKQLDAPGHPGGKHGLLHDLWSEGPTVTVEDNAGCLRLAGEAGSWRVAVRHSLNRGIELPAEMELPI